MAQLALGGISLLLTALFVSILCLVAGCCGGRPAPIARPPFGAPAQAGNKQDANTRASAMGVHQVASSAGCWPGVWVGPSPAVQTHPAVVPGTAPVQRRRPSGIASRVTSHGVLR